MHGIGAFSLDRHFFLMANIQWIQGFHLPFFFQSVLEAWNILTVSRTPDQNYGTEEPLFFNPLMPTQE